MNRVLLAVSLLLGACIPAGDSAEFKFGGQNDTGITVSDSGTSNNDSGNTTTDSGSDGGNTTISDASVDLAQDMGCIPEGTTAVCARIAIQCGTARGTDNCGETRDVYCGSCVFGTGCASV